VAFVLKITNPEGGTYTWDENGLTLFTAKQQAALAVFRALAEIHPSMSASQDVRPIARDLETEPPGTEVAITSGYRFKIEEA
jgi:hypothetical protein